jgi:hypothetical protein
MVARRHLTELVRAAAQTADYRQLALGGSHDHLAPVANVCRVFGIGQHKRICVRAWSVQFLC